jgi:preprotein translocase subunit SecG
MSVAFSLVGMPQTVVLASFAQYFFGITLSLTAIFLILLVLVQRGRGGGLAGALGGMGGQSAFGTKAGDTFTRVTIIASVFWLLLCIASVRFLNDATGALGRATPPSESEFVPGGAGPAGEPLLPPAGESTPLGTPAADSPSTETPSTEPETPSTEPATPSTEPATTETPSADGAAASSDSGQSPTADAEISDESALEP